MKYNLVKMITQCLKHCICSILLLSMGGTSLLAVETTAKNEAMLQTAFREITVTGMVTDKSGVALPGVSILIEGATIGTSTDFDGNFSISVPNENSILVFSILGFSTQKIIVGNRTTINVVMQENVNTLDEVVVVGYGNQLKANITGAQQSIKSEKLTATSTLPSAEQLLQGKIAGVLSLGGSGQPGSEQQIRIRGIGSILASSEPLYVIDGIPVNSGALGEASNFGDFVAVQSSNVLANLNPNDIEDITVLKDAASASIYGSRAGNGVILITTKKGKTGKSRITLSSETGFNRVMFPDKARPANRNELESLYREGIINAGFPEGDVPGILSSLGLGADNQTDVDWFDVVTRQGYTQQHNLSVSGGNEKTSFYLSGGFYDQKGVVVASDFQRISSNINVEHRIDNKLKIGLILNISGVSQNNNTPISSIANPVFAAAGLLPSVSPYNEDGSLSTTNNFGFLTNPLYEAAYNKNTYFNLKGLGNAFVSYSPIEAITVTSRLGIDYNNIEELTYQNPIHGDGSFTGGVSSSVITRYFNWNWINQIDFRKDIGEQFRVEAKLGYEAQKSNAYFVNATGNTTPNNPALYLPAVASRPTVASGDASDYSFGAIFSGITMNYDKKYVVTASLRNDTSSRFATGNRSATFYSVGGAWNIDKEGFFSSLTHIISVGKLRASYGINGNASIGDYLWQGIYSYNSEFSYIGNLGFGPTTPGNNRLGWETNTVFDIGADFGLFNNRINLVFDYYKRITDRLLLNVNLPYSTGFSSQPQNVGEMENKGVEITVDAVLVDKGIYWKVYANTSLNKNRIIALDGRDEIFDTGGFLGNNFIRKTGYDFQSFYLQEYAGVDPQTGEAQWYRNTVLPDGSLDRSITTNYNEAQRRILGSASPKMFGGFGTSIRYKDFKLDADFSYVFGNYVMNTTSFAGLHDGSTTFFNVNRKQLERWQNPGDITDVPRFIYNNTTNSFGTSSRFLSRGDFIRLRGITLSYALPRSIIGKLGIRAIAIYVRGTNLLTWTKEDLLFDPEVGVKGLSELNSYQNRSIAIGTNINL